MATKHLNSLLNLSNASNDHALGVVVSANGLISAVINGTERLLKVGDIVYQHDLVSAEGGVVAKMLMADGRFVTITSGAPFDFASYINNGTHEADPRTIQLAFNNGVDPHEIAHDIQEGSPIPEQPQNEGESSYYNIDWGHRGEVTNGFDTGPISSEIKDIELQVWQAPDSSSPAVLAPTIQIIPEADLSVVKTVSDATPNVGDTITYTITVHNDGVNTATGVTVSDALPAGLQLISATTATGSYSNGVWTIGSLADDATSTLTVTALVISPDAQVNTASILHSDQYDPIASNNSSSVTETPQQADLSVVKTVSDSAPNVGDTITYTITVHNDGVNTATGVTVSDALPAGLQLISASTATGSYDAASGIWTIGNVADDATHTLTVTALVVSPDAQVNTASILHSDQYDPISSNNSSSVTETPQQADLSVVKTVSDSAPNVGDTITYTITVHNDGSNTATGVTVSDALPAGLQLISATTATGSYSNGVWTIGSLADDATSTLTVTALVVSPDAQVNTASILHSDQYDPIASNNSSSVTETPQQADLSVVKTVSDSAPNVGDTITYTITVHNDGVNSATGVTVSDALPAGLQLISASTATGSYDASSGIWTIGNVADDATHTLTVTALVVSPDAQINTASILHSDQYDPIASNNSSSVTETPQQADLSVVKTVSDATPNVGDTITYTITVHNDGLNTATGVTVSDALPAGLQLISASTATGSYDAASGIWTIGNVADDATHTLTVTALVVSPDAQVNTASILHSDQYDPIASNNSSSVTETPQQADLSVVKTVSDSAPNVGDTITYTITVHNDGLNTATGVTVSDALPAGLQLISATTATGSYSNGVWTIGSLADDATSTLTVTALVISPDAQVNTASILHSDQYDPISSNNSSSVTETPQQADLSVVKTVSDAIPNVGDTITYTITVHNDGVNTATGVTVSDALPAGLQLISATTATGSYSNGVWTIGSLADDATSTLTVTALVISPDAQVNTASILHSDQYDPIASNNSSSVTETPQQADLSVVKTVSDSAPNVGDTITYTITVHNDGSNTATGVTVSDSLPAGLQLISATTATGSYSNGVWTIGSLADDATSTLTVTALVISPDAQVNTASILHSDQYDPITSNNSSSVTETPQQADLSVVKTVSDATPNVGDTITYTITVHNDGLNTATGVTVSDALPAGLQLISATTATGSYSNGVWTIGSLADDATSTLTVTALVISPDAQVNTASILHSDQYDPITSNNSSSVTETPQQADIVITKIVSDETPAVGDIITYTITAKDIGPNAATNVTVSDTLPAGLQLISATPSVGSFNNGVWTIGTLNSGSLDTLTIVAKVLDVGSIINTASRLHSDQYDPNLSNNTATATIIAHSLPTATDSNGAISEALLSVQHGAIVTGSNPGSGPDLVSGNLAYSFTSGGMSSSPFTWSTQVTDIGGNQITSGGSPLQWTLSNNGLTLIGTATGGAHSGSVIAQVQITNVATGAYTFKLLGPIDNVNNSAEIIKLHYNITDGNNYTADANLNISVQDDSPVTHGLINNGSSYVPQNTNIMIIQDVSLSMDEASGLTNLSRLDMAKAAINDLLVQYSQLGNIEVRVVQFSTNATANATGWMSLAEAESYVNGLSAVSYTNYHAALSTAQTAFATPGAMTDAQNVTYFISDGQPTVTTTGKLDAKGTDPLSALQPAEQIAWYNFLTANHMNAFAIGMGADINSVAVTELSKVGFNATGVPNPALPETTVTDLSQLSSVLSSTIPTPPAPISGNIITDSASKFGADQPGFIKSITVDGTIYTYDQVHNTVSISGVLSGDIYSFNAATHTLSINTGSLGTLAIDMIDGDYSYQPIANTHQNFTQSVPFTLSDYDGTTSSNTLTLNITSVEKPPLIYPDHIITNINSSSGTLKIPDWALLNNDDSSDGSALKITSYFEDTSNMTLTHSNSVFTMSYTNNAIDNATFHYTAAQDDGTGQSSSALVHVSQQSGNTISGTGLGEILIAANGNNTTINGNGGNDVFIGGSGNDKFVATGNGFNIFEGGTGNDTYTGGTGHNLYEFAANDVSISGQVDTIKNFNANNPTLSSAGDILQLDQILQGVSTDAQANDATVIAKYLNVSVAGTGLNAVTTINISTTANGPVSHSVKLSGVDLFNQFGVNAAAPNANHDVIQDMLNNHNLNIVHS